MSTSSRPSTPSSRPGTPTRSLKSNSSSRPGTPSDRASKEDFHNDSVSSSGSISQTGPEIAKMLEVELRSRTVSESEQSSSRGTTPVKYQRVSTPSEILRPASVTDISESNKELKAIVKHVFEQLVGRTIDYCFRILDQCDRSKHNFCL